MRRRKTVHVSILPTLPAHAGMSMSHYSEELVESLQGFPEVTPCLEWPPFGSESRTWFTEHWIRYVQYVRWCSRLRGDIVGIEVRLTNN